MFVAGADLVARLEKARAQVATRRRSSISTRAWAPDAPIGDRRRSAPRRTRRRRTDARRRAPRRARSRSARADALHERHVGQPEGRAAHAPQRRRATAPTGCTCNAPLLAEGDRDLLWLPMSHIFGFGELCLGNTLGWETYLATPADVLELLPEVAPHVFMTVPAYWEKLARAIQRRDRRRARGASPAAACGSASPAAPASRSRSRSCSTRTALLDHRGLRPHRDLADADAEPPRRVPLRHRRQAAAVASSSSSTTTARSSRAAPNVFAGYFKDPAATAAAFTDDGWFRTGDVGRWTDDGFLQIIDRKKDILVTAGGKNVPPANIEVRFVDDPVIERVVVYGDARRYLVAAVWAASRRARTPSAIALVAARVDAINARARALRDDQAPLRRRRAADRRGRHADLVAQAAPQDGLRAPARPLRGALRMNAPTKIPTRLDRRAAAARAERPAAGRRDAALGRVDREQVAPAAVRAGAADVHDADPARAVADQPLVRARSRADALADRVARRAGPRGVLHRLGHARRRGSLPDVGRHRRSLHRPRAPHVARALALAATAHVLGYCLGGTLATTLRRRVPRARRVVPRARRADRLRPRRHHGDVDAHADVRRRRAASRRSATCRGR